MSFTRDASLILTAALTGACAGALASVIVTPRVVQSPSAGPSQATSTRVLVPTSTVPIISLVSAERRGVSPLVPPEFLKRRSTAVGTLYRKPKGSSFEERMLAPEKMLGRAVSLTSDGWFAAPASEIEGLRVADLTLWHGNASYPIERVVVDHLTNMAFLKTRAKELFAPAFVPSNQVSIGAEIWVEALPGGFAPDALLETGYRMNPNDTVSSETAARRFLLSGATKRTDRGGAAWDSNGALVGIIESMAGESMRLIPASLLTRSLASLLETGETRHAALGVRAIDLASLRIDGSRDGLPERGAYLHDDKREGKPAVKPNSSAEKAKLKTGDVILRVERDILDGSADLGEILADYRPGSSVTLHLFRDGKEIDVLVTLDSAATSEPLK